MDALYELMQTILELEELNKKSMKRMWLILTPENRMKYAQEHQDLMKKYLPEEMNNDNQRV